MNLYTKQALKHETFPKTKTRQLNVGDIIYVPYDNTEKKDPNQTPELKIVLWHKKFKIAQSFMQCPEIYGVCSKISRLSQIFGVCPETSSMYLEILIVQKEYICFPSYNTKNLQIA